MRRTGAFFLAALSLLVCAYGAAGRLLNPDAPHDAVLQRVLSALEAEEMDVVQDRALERPPADRVRLSAMRGFKANETAWTAMSRDGWTRGFERGMVGALLAVPASSDEPEIGSTIDGTYQRCMARVEGVNPRACDFVATWRHAEPEERVFVAFTRQDWVSAEKVRLALERAGYVVFTYLRDEGEEPWASADLVGACFAEARHHYVIDSGSARGSVGVGFEARACEVLLDPPARSELRKWYEALGE